MIILLALFAPRLHGQISQDNTSTTKNIVKQIEATIYRLFPTENYWTFIKLDTRNGKMWQVHFTITEGEYEGELILNSNSLVLPTEETNSRTKR